jgi:starvation-inducible DNA-binding protein
MIIDKSERKGKKNMRKQLVLEVNKQIANLGVSYIKFHNLHWNVVGGQFKPVHEYLEVLYDSLSDSLDEVAEILKMNDEYPVASLKQFLELSQIQELNESKDINYVEVLKMILDDLVILQNQAKVIRNLAVEDDIIGLIDSMEGIISNIDKELWFIKSMLK